MPFTIDFKSLAIDGNKIIVDCGDINPMSFIGKDVLLSSIEVGEKFTIGDEEFIMLEKMDYIRAAKVIRADFLPDAMEFGPNNNWKESPIRAELNSGNYYKKIAELVGEERILSMDRDLTSLDGLDDYGTCVDKISLLTAAEYARYHKILGVGQEYPDAYWTITPNSTPSNNCSKAVCCCSMAGILDWGFIDLDLSVRPFLMFDTSVLVSRSE